MKLSKHSIEKQKDETISPLAVRTKQKNSEKSKLSRVLHILKQKRKGQ